MPTSGPLAEPYSTPIEGGEPTGSGAAVGAGRWTGGVVRPVAIYLASRAVVFAALAVSLRLSGLSLPDEITEWDGQWFLRASRGWPGQLPMVHGHVAKSPIAFFPVLPLMIRGLSSVTGMSGAAAGALISALTGLSAVVAVWLLVRHYAGRRAADGAALVLAFFPGSVVFSLVYAEGLVITLVALGLLALRTRRWVVAGLLGMAATAVAPIALAFVASGLWVAVAEWRASRALRPLWAPVLTPLGALAYLLWLWGRTGNRSAFFLTERQGWHSYLSPAYPLHLLWRLVGATGDQTATGRILIGTTLVTVVCIVIAFRERLPAPVLVYGLAAAALALCTAPVGLRPRLLLGAFPLLLAVGAHLHRRWLSAVVAASALGLFGWTVFTVSTVVMFP